MYVLSSIMAIDCRSCTISFLDLYTLRGLIKNRSKALKLTLVINTYALGDTELMKHWMEAWVMITLSTVDWLDQSPRIQL